MVNVAKVPSHKSPEAFLELPGAMAVDWLGNRLADEAAKKGALLHGDLEAARRKVRAAEVLVETVGLYVGKLLVHLSENKLLGCHFKEEAVASEEPPPC